MAQCHTSKIDWARGAKHKKAPAGTQTATKAAALVNLCGTRPPRLARYLGLLWRAPARCHLSHPACRQRSSRLAACFKGGDSFARTRKVCDGLPRCLMQREALPEYLVVLGSTGARALVDL